MKRALVCGAGGFIGSYMVKALRADGFWVRGVDSSCPIRTTEGDNFSSATSRPGKWRAAVKGPSTDLPVRRGQGGAGFLLPGKKNPTSVPFGLNQLEMLKAPRGKNPAPNLQFPARRGVPRDTTP